MATAAPGPPWQRMREGDPEEAAVTTAETGAADAPPAQTGAQGPVAIHQPACRGARPQILHLLHAVGWRSTSSTGRSCCRSSRRWRARAPAMSPRPLAETAVRQIGLPVLRLDCNPPSATASGEKQPPSLIDAFRTSSLSETALRSLAPNLLLARLSNAADGVYGMSPADLQLLFDACANASRWWCWIARRRCPRRAPSALPATATAPPWWCAPTPRRAPWWHRPGRDRSVRRPGHRRDPQPAPLPPAILGETLVLMR